jgi:cell division protein FtsL
MSRVNLVLVVLLVICALGAVTSQHKARKLYQALEAERERARALDVEFDQLQIEQSTWAVHTRIERVATERLRMHRPAPSVVVRLAEQP